MLTDPTPGPEPLTARDEAILRAATSTQPEVALMVDGYAVVRAATLADFEYKAGELIQLKARQAPEQARDSGLRAVLDKFGPMTFGPGCGPFDHPVSCQCPYPIEAAARDRVAALATPEPAADEEGLERWMEVVSDSLAATTEGTEWAEAPEPSDEPGSPYVRRLTNEILARLATPAPTEEMA